MLIKLAICFQYGTIFSYVSELFPTHLRGFALGFTVAIGRFMSSLSSYMIFITDSLGMHPFATALLAGVVSLPFSIILEETAHKKLSN